MPIIAVSTASTPWTEFTPLLAPHVPECPFPLMRAALIRACREFFCDSHCWRDKGLTLLTTVAAQSSYPYNTPENAELLRIHAAWDGLTEVDVGLPDEGDNWSPDDTDTSWSLAVAAASSAFEMTPTPSAGGLVIKGSISYTTTPNATGIPTWVFNEHKMGLAMGAAAELVIQPKKPWTNPGAYQGLRSMFSMAVRDASNKAGPVRRKALRTKVW